MNQKTQVIFGSKKRYKENIKTRYTAQLLVVSTDDEEGRATTMTGGNTHNGIRFSRTETQSRTSVEAGGDALRQPMLKLSNRSAASPSWWLCGMPAE